MLYGQLANDVVSSQEDVCSNAGTEGTRISKALIKTSRICGEFVILCNRYRRSTKTGLDDEVAGLLKEQKLLMYGSLEAKPEKRCSECKN